MEETAAREALFMYESLSDEEKKSIDFNKFEQEVKRQAREIYLRDINEEEAVKNFQLTILSFFNPLDTVPITVTYAFKAIYYKINAIRHYKKSKK